MIDQSTIDRILDAAKIEDVVSEFVSLKKRGSNYIGLCPFHNDKTPSFYVSPSKGLCKCFACGKGGNAAHFVMKHEQMNYYDALRWLAKKYHIEVRERELSDKEKEAQNTRESLLVVNEFACGYFQDILNGNNEGKSYFKERGIRDDIVKKFQLGYCLSGKYGLAQEAVRRGYKKEFLVNTGLCYEKDDGSIRDRFWGRVVFPWFNVSGRVVGFGGRVLDSRTKGVAQKYINSPESEIYSKRKELYGIYQAKSAIVKNDNAYIVEGYTDVIAMHQCGIENVVANSGTALSEEQIRLLHRFTSNVTLIYDSDEAGIKASIRGIDMFLVEGMNVKVVLLPKGEDPDSFSRKADLQKYINENEENFMRFKCNLLLKDTMNDPVKRAALISDIAHSIGMIPNNIVRYEYMKECASILDVSERIIQNEIDKVVQERIGIKSGIENTNTEPNDLVYQCESLLIREIVRHGEQRVCSATTEDGEQINLSVVEYIYYDLEQDGLSFKNPIHQLMLNEAMEHINDDCFSAWKFFLSHEDPAVSAIAAEQLNDRYQLSRSNKENMKEDKGRLNILIPQLMAELKKTIIDDEMKQTAEMLNQNDVITSTEKTIEIMKRYKELTEISKRLNDWGK